MHARRFTAGVYTGLLLLLMGCFTPSVNAYTLLSASPSKISYSLAAHSEFWHANDNALTLSDLFSQSPSFEHADNPADLNFGYTKNNIWLRTQVHNNSAYDQRWVVQFEYPFLDHVTLYTLRHHSIEKQQSGSAVPVEQRALSHRQAVFPLALAAHETVTIYAHVAASGSKLLSYNLLTPEAFYAQNDQHNFWLATYFGMLLALGLYNFLLYLSLKERVLLHYTLFIGGFSLAILSFNGIGTLMFWSFLGDNTSRLVAVGFTFASAMASLFTQSFLNTARYCPRWHQAITLFRGYCWLALVATLLLPMQPALRLTDITGFTASLLMLVCGIYCSWQQVPSARLFVLAWSIFLVGAAVFALRNLGILPANFITLHGIQIGSALEMLLLSFALAARFNRLKRQKEIAQANIVNTLKKQEALLELKVAARTKALEHLANYDVLTGLLNRNGLLRSAEEALKRSRQNNSTVSLFMLDLDRFKPINDVYGHEAGDFVLHIIAKRIDRLARSCDHCARFGGDEFVIIMENIGTDDTLEDIQRRIGKAVRAPIQLPCGEQVSVGVSIGVSTCTPEDNANLQSLLREADSNMYAVKARIANDCYRCGPTA